jgi:glycyl-tRNA synthetase
MDEAGTPFGITVDGETLAARTVTIRHRDSMQQERVGLDRVADYIKEKLGAASGS